MLKVGLTGGIGCGKSTVCQLFAAEGVPIIDADTVARQLVKPGQPALSLLCQQFGEGILNADGSLNRGHLRTLAFSNATYKQQLDAIMHPLIYAAMKQALHTLSSPYCLLVVPLLIETNHCHWVDQIVVVDCEPDTQLQRLLARDHCSRETAERIINSQISRTARLARADWVIDNNADRATDNGQLAQQVKKLHNSLYSTATVRTPA
jgi:dephospho-CoA kinase